MANQGEIQLPNHPVQHIGHADVPAGHLDHLLDAARGLILLGAVAAISTVGNPDANAAQVFLAFVAFVACWLLGVCFLSLVPVAGRYPQADRLAGAAIASVRAVLRHVFNPWN